MRNHLRNILMAVIFTSTFIIAQVKDQYDLSIVSFSYEPQEIKCGDKVVFKYSIVNLGLETIPKKAFQIEFFVDGKLFNFDYGTSEMRPGKKDKNDKYVNGMLVGTVEYGTPKYKALKKGKHTYKLVLDTKNQIAEKNKANNVKEGSFIVY